MNAETKVKAGETLHTAMAAAFAEIEAATKDATNPHFKSKYADLSAIIGTIKPPLVNHGLFFTQHPQPSERGITVETFLHHASGESLSLGALYVPANKTDPQGFGSALTYARRYALQTAFGVPTEDDDGNGAVKDGAEPKSDALKCTDAQRATIQTLADAANKPLKAICDAYKVASIADLTTESAEAAIKRLQELAKEPANA